MKSWLGNYLYVLLAVAAGMAGTAQAAVNNKLQEYVNSPLLVALVSFVVGGVGLTTYIIAAGIPFGSLWAGKSAPYIAWTGGLLGAFFVASAVILLPRLGVALTFSAIVAGQMILALVIDHFGWFGVPQKSISLMRIVGVTLVTIGVVVIRRY